MAKDKTTIKSNETLPNFPIIGTFEGISADPNITNKNGLDITKDVWEVVFGSEDYITGIENGWFIGYLGHPEDPNCMDFEHGCIVMTSGYIDETGKVQGKFNLVGTPVGRIVKTFIDAGVKFGISVRGAGDIVNNSVDPDTFVFRGFDLVTFPAYGEAVPEFTCIAAATDTETRNKYKKVCASVNKELPKINSAETIEVIQSQFAPQSDEYRAMEARKAEIYSSNSVDISQDRVTGMTELYLSELYNSQKLFCENERLKKQSADDQILAKKRISSIEKIMGSQLDEVVAENRRLVSKLNRQDSEHRKLVNKLDSLGKQAAKTKERISATQESNLIYKQKIEAHAKDLEAKDTIISNLRANLNETVNSSNQLESKASNLGAENKRLLSDLKACQELIESYQYAYADLYANALGINLDSLSINSKTRVDDLQKQVTNATNTANMSSVFVEPYPVEIVDGEDDDIITI